MNTQIIARTRLIYQQIVLPDSISAKQVLEKMGAVQAQDFRMAKWAIGLRMKNATSQMIHDSINNGDIIRTHVLRPTWHFVAADNIRWMLKLTAPRILLSMKSRCAQLEINNAVLSKSRKVFENKLKDKNHLTRRELVKELNASGIATNDNRSSHILMSAELNGVICSGKMKGNEPTYALMDEVVPYEKNFDRDKALFLLASIYFTSHCPATLADFLWWSGLSLTDGKKALQLVSNDFSPEFFNDKQYFFPRTFKSAPKKKSAFLLPAYDEYLISYKDRSASLPEVHQPKTFSNNGIFRPVIVEDGIVMGTWKNHITGNEAVFHLNLFENQIKMNESGLQRQAEKYARFLGVKIPGRSIFENKRLT